MTSKNFSEYDSFAWIYDRYWGDTSTRQMLNILRTSALDHIPTDGTILDLCCGTGQLAHALSLKGYHVIGIDSSEQMLRFAKRNAPNCRFIQADARSFKLEQTVDLAVSAFDSLNHIMSLDELKQVFDNVHSSIKKGGLFVFDLNMEEGFKARWRGSFGIVGDDHSCVIRSNYNQEQMIGKMDITMFFRKRRTWSRSDLALLEKCYTNSQITSTLKQAGFDKTTSYDSQGDLGLPEVGRTFLVCHQEQEHQIGSGNQAQSRSEQ
jgi:SAM-dependent methyltransferase